VSPAAPSAWLERHLDALRQTAIRGPALDVACGRGRHARALAAIGHPVVGVDRNSELLAALAETAAVPVVRADLEAGHGLPFAAGVFGAVLVFRYLHRPLAPDLASLLAPGGLLLYETFTRDQRALGWGPSRAAFLLEPGELPRLFPQLELIAYEEGVSQGEKPAAQASLAARRPA
jgi:SAM-dependent methyltransferase